MSWSLVDCLMHVKHGDFDTVLVVAGVQLPIVRTGPSGVVEIEGDAVSV